MRISRVAALMAAATTVGAALRIWSPGNGSLARDEALFLFVTQLPSVGEMLSFLRLNESHPPLFYLLVRSWTALAGRSETTAAVIPLAAAIALIPATWWMGRRVFSPWAGIVAAWIVALSPTLVFHSPQIRPYSVFTLFALASCVFVWKVAEGQSRGAWVGYVACTVGMLLTHHWGWIILAAQGVVWFVVVFAAGAPLGVPELRRVGLAWLGVGIGYLPWLAALRYQMSVAGYPPQQVSAARAALLLPRAFFGRSTALMGAGLLVVMLVIVAVDLLRRKGPWSDLVGRGIVLIPFVCVAIAVPLSQRSALLLPQTLALMIPFLALLAGGATVILWQWGARIPAVAGVVAVLALMAGELNDRLRLVKSNARSVAEGVAARARPDDVVMIVPEALASSFNYYFRHPNRQIVFPYFSRREIMAFRRTLDRPADAASVAAAADTISQLHRRGQRIWFVSERDWIRDSVPHPGVPLPQDIDVYEAAIIRANHLRNELVRLYGPPDTTAVPADRRSGTEMYRAMLFAR